MTLEQLLNKLIEMGWKPWDDETVKEIYYDEHGFIFRRGDDLGAMPVDNSLNDLCSIDSGLWQFVCDNDLFDTDKQEDACIGLGNLDPFCQFVPSEHREQYQCDYRLMLSSIQEDKEKFLLENIKIPL